MTSLTEEQQGRRAAFRRFADEMLAPRAGEFDRQGAVDDEVVRGLAEQGWLGAVLPPGFGGGGFDAVTYGLLCEEIGRACSSTRSLLTVQNMVAATLLRWGTVEQGERWLEPMATGDVVAGFCLTEPGTGSDAKSVTASLAITGGDAVVSGRKLWVTFGQLAEVFLVIASADGQPTAVMVPRDAAGVTIVPVEGQLGLRAAMLAEIQLDECRVPADHVVAKPGFGFSHVAGTALDHGRYSVAWGCVGIGQACLEASAAYANDREQFGAPLREHQLVRRMISDMVTNVAAARQLCLAAGAARDARRPGALTDTMIAKYFAATMLARVASDAVQVHGANGCSPDYSVERHFRDAKIMQIIEGSDQMQQLAICDRALREYSA